MTAFDGLPRNHFAVVLADPPWHFKTYFARATRPGWSAWGNQVGKFGEVA